MESRNVSIPLEADKDISVLVKKFISLNLSNLSGNPASDKHIPDGSCCLVFNFSGKVLMSTPEVAERVLPPYFLTIPYLGYVNITPQCEMNSMIVVCKSSVLTRLTGISLESSKKEPYISANEIISEDVWQNMKTVSNVNEKIRIFSDYIRNNYSLNSYLPDEIDNAYEKIFKYGGCLKISDLIEESGMSERTFRASFRKRVGISAKSLSRLVRVHLLWRRIYESYSCDMQDLTFCGSFFDQPHLIHDIKRILGECPKKFFRRDLELVKFYSGF